MKDLEPERLVFLDETSVICGMTRLYGRALTNERVNDYVLDVRFKRVSVISTIRLSVESVSFMFNGTMNGDLFEGYVENFLAPSLSQGDILVLDNCSAHKKDALDPLYEKGVTVLFLPRYSPDFNPIENSWSKTKSTLRKLKARTPEVLEKSMGIALEFSKTDIIGWFGHCGYNANK